MTAEIAIMNTTAIALAADSAITVERTSGRKVYNTANKLFALSKYHPVGIMVYGNATLMEIPWETIIKIYRQRLGKQKYATLRKYANDFISFLDHNNPMFPAAEQADFFSNQISGYFEAIKNDIDEQVRAVIEKEGKVQDSQIRQIVTDTIRKHYEEWEKYKRLPSIPRNHAAEIIERYGARIRQAKDDVFQGLPISISSFNQLKRISASLFSKDMFPDDISGVVVAGFGENEIFPSIISLRIEGKVNNRLKYKEDRKAEINFKTSAWVVPFAQSQMVVAFVEGVDPLFRNFVDSYLSELFEKYPDYIVANIGKLDNAEKQELSQALKKVGAKILDDNRKEIQNHIRNRYIDPVLDAVAVLPKDELAAMAESLVNLTSFKQKISMETETVGGPIDVATISKGDGFIWIKRKHYFKPELNHQFFANYNREDDGLRRR